MGIRPTKRKPSSTHTAAKPAKPAKPAAGALRTPKPGPRGLRGPGRGRVSYIEAPPEWRGTTVQVCGLFPFAVGAVARPSGCRWAGTCSPVPLGLPSSTTSSRRRARPRAAARQ